MYRYTVTAEHDYTGTGERAGTVVVEGERESLTTASLAGMAERRRMRQAQERPIRAAGSTYYSHPRHTVDESRHYNDGTSDRLTVVALEPTTD